MGGRDDEEKVYGGVDNREAQGCIATYLEGFMTATNTIIRFIKEINYNNLPPEAVINAKIAIQDCVGVILLGAVQESGGMVIEFAKEMGGKPLSTILGSGIKTSPVNAAFANGIMGHSLDYDDTSFSMIGHPSVAILPAVIAISEMIGATGKEFLNAYILGFEIAAKMGCATMPHHSDKGGWHATGTLGTLGATAAAVKLLNLTEYEISNAFGIAVSEASGVRENFGTMTKSFHAGNAAKNGVIAALLAQKGFTAAKNIIEAPLGFCQVFCGEGNYHFEKIIERLGNPFDIIQPGIALKPYPCGQDLHPAIDAAFSILKEREIPLNKIKEIRCGVTAFTARVLIYPKPTTGLEGKFSMPYTMAAALLDKCINLDTYTDSMVRRSEIEELLQKVIMFADPRINWQKGPRPVIVEIELEDGKIFSRRVDISKGNPENPMTGEESEKKYRDCARFILGEKEISQSLTLLSKLEELNNVSELITLLAGKA